MVMPQHGHFATPENLRRMATAAEDLGFDSIWASDHIIVPKPFVERFSPLYYEFFTTMGYLAAITDRVKLGSTVLILNYRHPVMTAKQIATLDQLSGGRVILGATFGWIESEYDVLGIPYQKRGARGDEIVAILKHCWAEGDQSFKGEFYEFDDFAFEPKPAQQPHPPIWFGGNDNRTLERVVKFGNGWHPITSAKRPGSTQWTLSDFRERITRLRDMAEAAGRDPAEIAVSLHIPIGFDADGSFLDPSFHLIGDDTHILRNLDICQQLGLEHVVLNQWYTMPGMIDRTSVDGFIRAMERIARDILPRYR
jgi:probable F420-dependent oxidoreductase